MDMQPQRHGSGSAPDGHRRTGTMEWHKPEVTEQEVGLEVTSYLPAEFDHD
jgi:coenzyme PQQ precursor peptide PqqA